VAGTHVFAGTHGFGVYLLKNRGTTWSEVNTGLGALDVTSLVVRGNELFAGTLGGSVWKRPLSEMVTSLSTPPGEKPKGFALMQNYPNPFNPKTVVRSQYPVASWVKLAVYDLLGREVTVLVNEWRAAGSYQDSFDGTGLASGVYFCRMTAGSFTQSRKMILAR
jgi:hypothetical protein